MKLLYLFLILSLNSIDLTAQSAKTIKIEELLTLTRSKEMIPLIVNNIVDKFKGQNSKIPESYWEEIKREIDYDTFLNKTIDIYVNNYSIEELDEMINVFNSGDVEKYQELNQKITPLLYEAGNEFGQNTVKTITAKIKAYKG